MNVQGAAPNFRLQWAGAGASLKTLSQVGVDHRASTVVGRQPKPSLAIIFLCFALPSPSRAGVPSRRLGSR
jgi:hypothetical protein